MIRKLSMLAVIICMSNIVFAADKPAHFNLALIPPVEISSNGYIEGLELGIIASKKQKVEGVQTGFIYAATRETSMGVQLAAVTKSTELYGVQYGFVNVSGKIYGEVSGVVSVSKEVWGLSYGLVNVSGKVKGLMAGYVNVADEVSGVQLGLVNYTKNIEGIQIGFVNIITRSSLPFMVIANGRFK